MSIFVVYQSSFWILLTLAARIILQPKVLTCMLIWGLIWRHVQRSLLYLYLIVLINRLMCVLINIWEVAGNLRPVVLLISARYSRPGTENFRQWKQYVSIGRRTQEAAVLCQLHQEQNWDLGGAQQSAHILKKGECNDYDHRKLKKKSPRSTVSGSIEIDQWRRGRFGKRNALLPNKIEIWKT
jgi:hypothetical protein